MRRDSAVTHRHPSEVHLTEPWAHYAVCVVCQCLFMCVPVNYVSNVRASSKYKMVMASLYSTGISVEIFRLKEVPQRGVRLKSHNNCICQRSLHCILMWFLLVISCNQKYLCRKTGRKSFESHMASTECSFVHKVTITMTENFYLGKNIYILYAFILHNFVASQPNLKGICNDFMRWLILMKVVNRR